MASLTMMASFSGVTGFTDRRVTILRRGLVMAKATAKAECQEPTKGNSRDEGRSEGRRAVMLAAAATAMSAVGGMAIAGEELKRGTPEAKKRYAPICVTMPTAKICHN